MRGHLTKWLFGLGLTFFCTGGWALHHAARAHPVGAAHSLYSPGGKAHRTVHGTPAVSGRALRGQRRTELERFTLGLPLAA